jgi:glycosyltransferase involved in cell wall biosynthesis
MTTLPHRVSVIVPTKNRSILLRQALLSIRALEGPDLDLEIIVADNGSSDDTSEVARALGARFVQTNVPGAAAARNAGLRAATGEFIGFLDDDDVWLPGHLRPHLSLLASSPDLDAVVGQVINTDQTLARRSAPWPQELPTNGKVFPAFLACLPQIGATLVRASVRDSIGYFDEQLIGDQDWDWHLRLALSHRVGFVPTPCVLFRQRNVGERDDLHWLRSRFTHRVFWQNVRRAGPQRPPLPVIARVALRHRGQFAGHFLRSAAAHVAAGDPSAAYRALIWALRSSPLHVASAMLGAAETRKVAWSAVRGQIGRRTMPPTSLPHAAEV